MKLAQWLQFPRLVLTLFISLMLVCALALGWLGWQLVKQESAAEGRRQQEQLDTAADRAVAATERALSAAAVQVTVTSTRYVEILPPGGIAYAPTESMSVPVPTEVFSEAEALERSGDDGRPEEKYARLAQSDSAQIRGEALLRLARVLRRHHKWSEALQAYDALGKLEGTTVAGMPAGVVAREARCAVLAASGHEADARRDAEILWADLIAGKWTLTRATLETYLNELRTILPNPTLPRDWEERMSVADAARWAFEEPASSGGAARSIDSQLVWVSWERREGAWKAQLIGPSAWQALWKRLEHDLGVTVRVTGPDGEVLHGDQSPHGSMVSRSTGVPRWPWSLTVTSVADDAVSAYGTARRKLLIAGLLVFAAVLGLGSWLIAQAISREFAVARLQSDFVAAVSHEFRTPLTSIRQLAEMLALGRMDAERDRQRAYELVLSQSDRLRRLVESLLDFGRMQAREYKFRADRLDASDCFRSVAEEFQDTVRNRGYTIEFTGPGEVAWIRGDREALSGALWNFLDNAVKYSPDDKQVHVNVACSNGHVEVSVRDHGSGIAKADVKRVFGKFYRGANARSQETRGTGIGLALVKAIVEAHGGTVGVRSEPGAGSEFTMVLPCRES